MSKKLNLPLALGIFLIGLFSVPSSSKAVVYYWDTTAGLGNGTGGNGTFTTSTNLWSTDPAGSATLVANAGTTNDIANFQGTAGTVSFSNNLTQGAFNINATGYTFTTASSTTRTLSGTALTLGNNVNLNLTSFSTGALKFQSNSISGGTGSSLTLTSSSGKRAVLLDSGATVASSAPIIFNITGSLAAGDYMAIGNSSGTGTVNSTITGNSGVNDMTFYSSAILVLNGAVSGSQGVSIGGNGLSMSGRVELNASNSYAGKTALNGGTVYVSNNFAFSTNSIVVNSNSTIRGNGVLTNNQIANAVEFGASGANLIIGGYDNSNSISFNGIISGAGSVSAAAKTGSTSYSAYLMNTNNTFNGGVFSSNGYTMYVANIGNKADTKSAIGTASTITLGNATTSGSLRWLGSAGNEVSDKDFSLRGTNAILANGANGASLTLNGAMDSTAVAGDKRITFAGYNSNTLTINGLINELSGSTNSVTIGATSSGTVVLGNAANNFSGAVTISQGTDNQTTTLETANIGNSGFASALGKNGVINIGSTSSSRNATLKYTGTGETSDKVINLSGTTGGAILSQSGTGDLKFTSAMTATGSGAKSITLQGDATATGELAGDISDLGGNVISLNKYGSGDWILSGSNSYSGVTTVKNAGSVLKIMSANALSAKTSLQGESSWASVGSIDFGSGGSYTANSYGTTNLNGNNLIFTNSSGANVRLTFTNANNYITSSASGGKTISNSVSNTLLDFDGNVEIGSTETNSTTFAGAGSYNVDGNLLESFSGSRTLEKTGTGTLTVRGSANNYKGSTLVQGGVLDLYGAVTVSTNIVVSTSGAVSAASTTRTATATLDVKSGGSLLANSTTTVNSGGNLIVNGTAGSVVLESNGLLGGSGAVGNVQLKSGSLLNPGNSPGLLTAASSSWAAGSTYNWEIDQATGGTAGVNWDVFSVVGALDLSALSSGSKMNLVLQSLPSMDDYSTTTQYSWVFAQAGSLVGASFADGTNVTDLFNINATAFNAGVGPANGWRVEVGTDANNLRTLNLMAIPEPSTGSMLGLGLAGLVVTRLLRRKNS